jgi:hypothetical protein
VCDPRQVWTAAICFGFVTSVMSKMRTPRKRSALTVASTPCVPQSTRPRVCSTDMNSRLPCTDTSPWPPGQITDASTRGFLGSSTSNALKPLKLPRNMSVPLNAMSEFAKFSPLARAALDAAVDGAGAGSDPAGRSGGVGSPAGCFGS